ncbi:MAG: N-acetylglutamate synthase [Nocardioidaceae bacterium]|nr:N-acetylglutamate synthase [Nocardioidaceae bacterium]
MGPHVVGQRVVVRRVLPGETGPSGGPAMTDVLGTCTAWGNGVCVVEPDGEGSIEPVTIRIQDIVSGKPVPPRSSTRHRVSPAEAQRRALALWPDLELEPLGDWLLRHSRTSTARRANSVLAMGPSGVADDYDRVVAHYDALGQRPIAAVLPDSDEDALFKGHGWVLESHDHDTVFQLAGIAAVRRQLGRDVPAAELHVQGRLVTARIDDAASGVAAVDGDWAGFRTIEVVPDRRREGLGLAVMAALVGWAAEQGATTAYLQVLGDNAPALALYDRLGFVEHHRYRYLAAPR